MKFKDKEAIYENPNNWELVKTVQIDAASVNIYKFMDTKLHKLEYPIINTGDYLLKTKRLFEVSNDVIQMLSDNSKAASREIINKYVKEE